MRTHKAIALAGLALALAILSPASALAKAGGTDRPVKGTVSGNAQVNLLTGDWAVDFAGVSTHVGNYTVHAEGTSEFLPNGTLVGTGTATIVAANGDQITGTVETSTADPAPGVHTGTTVMTITGGTGRFADASGVLTTFVTSTSFIFVPPIVYRNDDVGTVTGYVSY